MLFRSLTSLTEVKRLQALSKRYKRSVPNKKSIERWVQKYDEKRAQVNSIQWNESRYESAERRLANRLKTLGKLTPLPLKATKQCFTDLTKSAGFNKSGARQKADIPFSEVAEVYERLSNGDPCSDYVSTVGFRSHLVRADQEEKVRIIHVTAGPLAFVEKMFAYPIQQAMMNAPYNNWATGWAWDRHGGQVIRQRFRKLKRTISLDFQSFDLCCRTRLTRTIFGLWKNLFDLTDQEERCFDSIVEGHCHSYIRHSGGLKLLTDGVRTGSSFTHIMGTMVSAFLMEYCDITNYYCYGDDVIAEGDYEYIKFVLVSTGFSLHPTKTKVGSIHWLGLKLVGDRWVLEDPDARMAKLFLPEPGRKPHSLATRMQASILNSGKDPMAERMICMLEKCGLDVLSEELGQELQKWGRSYEGCTYSTIRELYEYCTAEFV